MPVIHLRIDNRLIHGQATASWVGHLKPDHILVVNDQVARDPILSKLYSQALQARKLQTTLYYQVQKPLFSNIPPQVETSVLEIDKAAEYLETEKGKREKVMVIARFPSDALALIEKGLNPEEIIVGNQIIIRGTRPVRINRFIWVTPEQAEIYRSIAQKGYSLKIKIMPLEKGKDLLKALEEKGL